MALTARSRSETSGDAGEREVGLLDAGAVRRHLAVAAAAVAVHRPEGETPEAVGLRPVADRGPVVQGGQLVLVGQSVHAGDADVLERLGVAPAEGRLELVL